MLSAVCRPSASHRRANHRPPRAAPSQLPLGAVLAQAGGVSARLQAGFCVRNLLAGFGAGAAHDQAVSEAAWRQFSCAPAGLGRGASAGADENRLWRCQYRLASVLLVRRAG
uniref:Secreted protein n=1 Tax=Macrostomum lignano TaxID=282301 RepID=A0A1I8GMF2_9PLAT